MIKLPEFVKVCPHCKGKGKYDQNYTLGCGMGTIRMPGDCETCNGIRYVYKATCKPVPRSVVYQIEGTSDDDILAAAAIYRPRQFGKFATKRYSRY